jgi:hypothetical protein
VHKESEKVENYLPLRNNGFEVVGAIATVFDGDEVVIQPHRPHFVDA